LELLAFDEKSPFDFFALFARIKRGAQRPRGRVNCQNFARARRAGAMHKENLRKFKETRAHKPPE
jgi:hypothetical protein